MNIQGWQDWLDDQSKVPPDAIIAALPFLLDFFGGDGETVSTISENVAKHVAERVIALAIPHLKLGRSHDN